MMRSDRVLAVDAREKQGEVYARLMRALHEELKTQLEPQPFAEAWARGQQRDLSTLVVEMLRSF